MTVSVPRMTYLPLAVPAAPVAAGANAPKTIADVEAAIQEKFAAGFVKSVKDMKGDPFVVVKADVLHDVIALLRDDARFLCTNLEVISSTDFPPMPAKPATDDTAAVPAQEGRIETLYVVTSYQYKHQISVKVYLDRDGPRVASICDLYRCANWYERECYDLVGVDFTGHPDLQRILLPTDWVGHPLRRDYVFPEEYNGMKVPL